MTNGSNLHKKSTLITTPEEKAKAILGNLNTLFKQKQCCYEATSGGKYEIQTTLSKLSTLWLVGKITKSFCCNKNMAGDVQVALQKRKIHSYWLMGCFHCTLVSTVVIKRDTGEDIMRFNLPSIIYFNMIQI